MADDKVPANHRQRPEESAGDEVSTKEVARKVLSSSIEGKRAGRQSLREMIKPRRRRERA